MAITEAYQDAGDFSVSMETTTPELMSTVKRGGYLIVTNQNLGDPRGYTIESLFNAARYTGIVIETIWRDGVLTLEGAGLDWLLGDRFGIGWPVPNRTYTAAPLDTIIDEIAAYGLIPPVLTVGTVTNTGDDYTGTHIYKEETAKQIIMPAMEACKAHYRINPNGSVDAAGIDTDLVYKATPEIVMVADGWGSDALWTGIPIRSIESSESIGEWDSDHEPYIFGPNNVAVNRFNADDSDPLDQPVGGMITSTEIRTDFSQLDQAGGAVGDVVYVYHPGNGFTGPDTIWFRGRALNPAHHRLHEVEWDLTDGVGCYYVPGGWSTSVEDVVDLTATVATVPAGSASTFIRSMDVTPVESGGG